MYVFTRYCRRRRRRQHRQLPGPCCYVKTEERVTASSCDPGNTEFISTIAATVDFLTDEIKNKNKNFFFLFLKK